MENQTEAFSVSASDPDNDVIIYEINELNGNLFTKNNYLLTLSCNKLNNHPQMDNLYNFVLELFLKFAFF